MASDHAGFRLKNYLVSKLKPLGYKVTDFGSWKYTTNDDYPDTVGRLFAHMVGARRIDEDVSNLQKLAFEYTENLAKFYYSTVLQNLEVTNPLNRQQKVIFSHTGWNHMVEKKRSLNELITRFFALPRVPYLLQLTKTQPIYIKRSYKNDVEEYWAYEDIIEGVKIKVVLSSANNGLVSFLSTMWKGSVDVEGIKIDEKTKEELSLACKRRRELSTTEAEIIPQLHVLEKEYQTLGEKSTVPSIIVCRNGVGVSVLANKFNGVRCALSWNPEHVKSARNDDNVNCLALPADYITKEVALQTALTFLETPFSNEERHKRRLAKYGNTGNF